MAEITETKEKTEKEKKIAKIRKRRKAIVISGFAGILLIVLLILVYAFVFRVKSYKIEYVGEVPYNTDEITSALSDFYDKNLFSVSTEDISPVLESKLPYITNVKVLRKLPNKLVVTVECSEEIYAVELNAGMYAITDGKLKVLKLSTIVPEGVTMVQGRNSSEGYEIGKPLSFTSELGDDEIQVALCDIAAEAEHSELKNISMIDINNPDGIYMIYDERIVVRLGNVSNMTSKISLAKKSIDEENEISPKGYGELNVTISKKAVFAPKDYKDLEELMLFKEKKELINVPVESQEDAEEAPEDNGNEEVPETTESATEDGDNQ